MLRLMWIMDAHRKRHAPSFGVAGAAGNTAGMIASLTFLDDILPTRGVRVGCGDCELKRAARPCRGLGSETSVARSHPAVPSDIRRAGMQYEAVKPRNRTAVRAALVKLSRRLGKRRTEERNGSEKCKTEKWEVNLENGNMTVEGWHLLAKVYTYGCIHGVNWGPALHTAATKGRLLIDVETRANVGF